MFRLPDRLARNDKSASHTAGLVMHAFLRAGKLSADDYGAVVANAKPKVIVRERTVPSANGSDQLTQ